MEKLIFGKLVSGELIIGELKDKTIIKAVTCVPQRTGGVMMFSLFMGTEKTGSEPAIPIEHLMCEIVPIETIPEKYRELMSNITVPKKRIVTPNGSHLN